MDFVNAALTQMRLASEQAERNTYTTPWEIVLPKGDNPVAYYFARGTGLLKVGSQKSVLLQSGDLVFVSKGDRHVLSNTFNSQSGLGERKNGRAYQGEMVDILSCKMRAQLGLSCPFVSALPAVLQLKAGGRGDNPYLESLIQNIVWESGNRTAAASNLVVSRSWELVFVMAFRDYLTTCDAGTHGWLAGTRDPQLSRVFAAIQETPHEGWTLEKLSEIADMSRATFIRRFTRIMGKGPIEFLCTYRMTIAANLLKQGEARLAVVAEQVGYGSEAAFSTAFRRHYKLSPRAYRSAGKLPPNEHCK